MAGQSQDQFEVYFRRADLDGDGRISGAEAVSFFQGSNLPKQVLAQIWNIADQSRTGFLGRQEFYNYLKLVTVAQSKRELTPDIVKAALYGPAAAKIPPPQINLPPAPLNQPNPMAVAAAPVSAPAPAPHMGTVNPGLSQNPGFRGPGVPNMSMNQPYFPNQQTQPIKPMQAMTSGIASRPTAVAGPNFSMVNQSPASPAGTSSTPSQVVPGGTAGLTVSNTNITSNWLGASPGGAVPSTPAATSLPQTSSSVSSQPNAKEPPGNGATTQSFFGGELFSAAAAASTTRQDSKVPTYSSTSTAASSTALPVASGTRPAVKSNSLDSLQSAFVTQPLGGQLQRAQSLPTSGQQVSTSSSSPLASSGISVAAPNSSDTSQPSWPKMKPSDIQKYTKVFIEVDTDRDGRITGEQARDLFLSWRLPREVLKQVWDLSDQDGDSMLSLREFCFALYLMERHREGHPLPAVLPSNVMYDQTLLSMTGQPRVAYGNPGWGTSPGFGQQPGVGSRPMVPATGPRPPVPVNAFQPGGAMPGNQHILRGSVLEDPSLDHNKMDQNSGNSIPDDGISLEKKVDETKLILDSKEKLEFYRTKMQELVLYKSRCDNRLNEITERAIADKHEAEGLGKKYEEKYKQVAEVASKLTIEEATYRDIQERKLELQQAIVNVERGGSVDGLLQVRADRIQSDLDELMKALTDRCKKHGLDVKFAAAIELPFGWQPGIQEGAAPWNEDWDKFEDEGFSNDLTTDVKNVSASTKDAVDDSLTPDSLANGDGKLENLSTSGHALESESGYTHSDDESARSPQGSPAGRTSLESPSQDFSDVFVRSSEADAETHRSFDESAWGAFDTNDDADSVWGFNAASTKDSDSEKHGDFFGSDDFGVKPVKTESPSAENIFRKKSIFFEESVPGTPQSRFGNSPRYSEAGDHFDSFSRFDSFSMQEGGFSPRQERLSRFDSVSSTKDLGHGRAFSSFDDSDPFGSSGPFKVSSESEPAKKASDGWGSF